MPKGTKQGKARADKKQEAKRAMLYKSDGQEYAQVLRMLGNGRLEAKCFDGKNRLCQIRGKMHKRVWIAAGDFILVGLRDFQDGKADVLFKYSTTEARQLKADGYLPDATEINQEVHSEEDIAFDFEDI